ncbi:hypothetical protein Ocin01_16377 [Orchesella cincta]|uniref:KaiC-like domain-containing protein n=1 Tax=Orchesella cincta TaxID=48709 RepID=A0A1D2MBD3_ORCCI|nr:hypothetical protein Ocin01_16377 [Orchesella cincta]
MASSSRRSSTSTTTASISAFDNRRAYKRQGLHPGTVLEIKGPEKSGKTFLLTYFIARIMTVYPEKKVVLIETRQVLSQQLHLHSLSL